MKKLLTFKIMLALILAYFLNPSNLIAQQQLSFTYDVSGNQTERNIVCINCSALAAQADLGDIKSPEPDSLQLGRKFTTYPNPLTEVLNVQWSSTDLSYIKTIDVFSLNRVRLYHKTCTPSQTETHISFLHFSAGMYVLRGVYNDGKQESVKVLKQ